MSVTQIESLEQFDNLKKENTILVVDFYADWCGPCKRIAPDYIQLSKLYKDVTFCKVNVDDNKDLATKYEISCMPTFLFLRNGEVLETVKGADLELIKGNVIKLLDNE